MASKSKTARSASPSRSKIFDLEAAAENRRERRDRVETPAAIPLAVQEHDVLDEGPDDVGHLPARRNVVIGVEAGRGAADRERADDPPAGVERHADTRTNADLEQAGRAVGRSTHRESLCTSPMRSAAPRRTASRSQSSAA